MANIVFVTWDGGGNVPPAVGIAVEMQRRGDTVQFSATSSSGPPSRRRDCASSLIPEARGGGRPPLRKSGQWECSHPCPRSVRTALVRT